MNIQPKVSVIVPIHNAGPYLNKCLDSLVQQTLEELEIILVLDCPTDGSDKIAWSYANKYDNIKIIDNKTNLHISNSRNRGLEIATGEYIGFSDHDDYRELEMYEKMYNTAKDTRANVVFCGEDTIEASQPKHSHQSEETNLQYDQLFLENCFLKLLTDTHALSNGVVHSHIYNTAFLKEYKLGFVDTRTISSEDHLFNIQVYSHLLNSSQKIVYIPKNYYHHILHPNNTSKSSFYQDINKKIYFLEHIETVINNHKIISKVIIEQLFEERIIRNLYTFWKYELQHKRIVHAFKILLPIKKHAILQKHIKNFKYTSKVTFPKNCFAFILKSFYV